MRRFLGFAACVLTLLSCNKKGDDATSEDGSDAAASDAAADAPPKPVELTDALLEEYLALNKELKDAADDGKLAILTLHGWTMERWLTVSSAVTQGMVSAMQPAMAEGQQAGLKSLDEAIATLEEQSKTATGEQRQQLLDQIEELKRSRAEAAATSLQVSDLDRKNAEVLKRWMPRLQEAGR